MIPRSPPLPRKDCINLILIFIVSFSKVAAGVLSRSCTTNMYESFSLVLLLCLPAVKIRNSPVMLLDQVNGAEPGLQFFGYRGCGCRADPSLFFALRIFHAEWSTCWFPHNGQPRVECGRAVIAGSPVSCL